MDILLPDGYICFSCGKPATKRCEKCYTTFCSEKCEKRSWEKHKEFCQELGEAITKRNDNFLALFDIGAEMETKREKRKHSPAPEREGKRQKTQTVQDILKRHGITLETNANVIVPVEIPENFETVAPMALSDISPIWNVEDFASEYLYPALVMLYMTTKGKENRAALWETKKKAFLGSIHFAGTVHYTSRPPKGEYDSDDDDDDDNSWHMGGRNMRVAVSMQLESAHIVFYYCPCYRLQRVALQKFVSSGARMFEFYGIKSNEHHTRGTLFTDLRTYLWTTSSSTTLPVDVKEKMTKITFTDCDRCNHVLESFYKIKKLKLDSSHMETKADNENPGFYENEFAAVRNACIAHSVHRLDYECPTRGNRDMDDNDAFQVPIVLLKDIVTNREAWSKSLTVLRIDEEPYSTGEEYDSVAVPSDFVPLPIDTLYVRVKSRGSDLEKEDKQTDRIVNLCLRILKPKSIERSTFIVN